ncbi:MAG: hypothetical protein LCH77_04010 [Actinobacteria bacterium]|nr:hypothetical protein [Actinomycetota bacterium]
MSRRIIAAALLTTTGALVASSAFPAQAAFPGANGRVAAEIAGSIFTFTKTGGSKVSLGPGTGPRYSPNGKSIAYALKGAIWTMNANGTGRVKITAGTGHDVNPAWSPDGKKIVFSRSASGTPSGRSLQVVTLATKAVSPLTKASDQSFCLASPCGSFYYDIPNDSTWVKSLDWQPLP